MDSKESNNRPLEGNAENVIFRMSFRHPITKKIIRSKDGKPFPIKVKSVKS